VSELQQDLLLQRRRMKEYHIYIDGASLGNPGRSGAGMVAFDEEGNEVWREGVYLGEMTNNMAEYEALVRALRRVEGSRVDAVRVYTDSLLVANQVLGKYRVKNEGLRPYLEEARQLMRVLGCSTVVKHIPREGNRIADKLAKNAASGIGVDVRSRDDES